MAIALINDYTAQVPSDDFPVVETVVTTRILPPPNINHARALQTSC